MAGTQSSRYYFSLLKFAGRVLIFLCLPVVVLSATSSRNEELMRLRSQLTPIIQSQLNLFCGTHCPSFSVDFISEQKKVELDNLGFFEPESERQAENFNGVNVAVLADDEVTPPQLASLRKILTSTVSNQTVGPVTVQFQRLSALGDELLNTKRNPDIFDRLAQIKPIYWPAALIISLMLLGLILFVTIREIKSPQISLQPPIEEEKNKESEIEIDDVNVQKIDLYPYLNERRADFKWLIENAAKLGNEELLTKLVGLFPSTDLSKMSLNSMSLFKLSQLKIENREAGPGDEQWLCSALDEAHWQRLYGESQPIRHIETMSEEDLVSLFENLNDLPEKALFLTLIPSSRWASLLTTVTSEERVALGVMISQLPNLLSTAQVGLEDQLREKIYSAQKDSKALKMREVLQDYSLYLSEGEGLELFQKVQLNSTRKLRAYSIDNIVDKLSEQALMALCLELDIQDMKAVIPQLSSSSQKRFFKVIPENLARRLSAHQNEETSESQSLKARARLITKYQALFERGV